MKRFATLYLSLALCTACSGKNVVLPASETVLTPVRSSVSSSVVETMPVPSVLSGDGKPIPILVYHHIRDTSPYPHTTWSYKMSVSPQIFDDQMRWISENNYVTIDLDTAVDILQGKQEGPKKPVIITFDDNNRTQFTIAFPILQKYGLIATFYLVTNRLENPSFILADEALAMSEAGMSIQSHTVSHATLTALSDDALEQQLADSRRVLEALIGKPVRHIAYPSTAQNQRVRNHAQKAEYVTGTIMDPRLARPTDDLWKLPRIMMTDKTVMESVLP
jgi:peptidoglycan/xylan/chitin deacetylase (PgdA/CDA1 family)